MVALLPTTGLFYYGVSNPMFYSKADEGQFGVSHYSTYFSILAIKLWFESVLDLFFFSNYKYGWNFYMYFFTCTVLWLEHNT